MSTWERATTWPKPDEPGIFRIRCSCHSWSFEGTAQEIHRASLKHDDSPWRQHIVSIRERKVSPE